MALLGQLTVGILGDLSGYSSSLNAAQKETLKFSRGIERMGKDISNIGNAMVSAGKTMTATITAPVVGLAGALVKTGIGYKAFKQESKQAFSVLLGSAEAAEKHMDNIMDFAKTTPFAFPDLVSANRKLVSFGMEAKSTEPVMEAIANSVAAMGGGGAEIENMADIFAKITANGKITGMELNRLGDQGINALAIMANQAGVSMEEMRKQISAGAIDSATAIDWLVDGMMNGTEGVNGATVAMGGSLEALDGTWKGAIDSMKGAWRRAGDEIVSDDMFDKITESVRKLTEVIGRLPDLLGPVVDSLGNILIGLIDKLSALIDWFFNLDPAIQQMAVKFGLALVAAGPLLMIFGKIIATVGSMITTYGTLIGSITKLGGVMGVLTGPIGIVIGAIAALIAIGVLLYKNWDIVKEKAQAVFTAFAPLLEVVKGAFQNLLDSVSPIMDSLKTLWQSLLPILEKLGLIIAAIVVPAFGILVSVFSAVISAIGPFVNAIINVIDVIVNVFNALIALLMGDFSGALEFWEQATESTIEFVKNLWETVVNFFSTLVESIIEFFYNLYMTLVGNSIIPDMVEAIIEWFNNLFKTLIEIVAKIVSGVITYFENMYQVASKIFEAFWGILVAIWEYIKNTFKNALDFLLALVTGDFEGMKTAMSNQMENARNLLSIIWERIKGLIGDKAAQILINVINKFNEIKTNMQNKINEAKTAVIKKFTEIVTGVGEKGSEIVRTVKNKFDEAKEKILTPIEEAKEKISGIVDDIKGFFENMKLKIPKIELPPMPKFSMSGGFSLNPPSVPKIDVNWYKDGGVFAPNNPHLIGIGDAKVPEAAIPLSDNVLGKIGEMIAKTMPSNGSRGDVIVYQTINSPDPLSPSETARLNKRAMQEMALRW